MSRRVPLGSLKGPPGMDQVCQEGQDGLHLSGASHTGWTHPQVREAPCGEAHEIPQGHSMASLLLAPASR